MKRHGDMNGMENFSKDEKLRIRFLCVLVFGGGDNTICSKKIVLRIEDARLVSF